MKQHPDSAIPSKENDLVMSAVPPDANSRKPPLVRRSRRVPRVPRAPPAPPVPRPLRQLNPLVQLIHRVVHQVAHRLAHRLLPLPLAHQSGPPGPQSTDRAPGKDKDRRPPSIVLKHVGGVNPKLKAPTPPPPPNEQRLQPAANPQREDGSPQPAACHTATPTQALSPYGTVRPPHTAYCGYVCYFNG
eukprot:scaffold3215_cov90-Isochrysis_galbana.AAC.2